MRQTRIPQHAQEDGAPAGLATHLYRFFFFGWLFADMARTQSPFERHCAWRHNRKMGRYLPIYLRRWAAIVVITAGLGGWCARMPATDMLATLLFIACGVVLTGMAVIVALWLFLTRANE